uniref:LRR receptor-like serine/threonine-protein kinase At1g53430 family n=1 Tax=Cajanus cajan TaxID=3821 RepID=A0A151SK23_CAJCA|nr:putative LRR receptor-like serine/threonine-protein kinase At1g53430 family [Cajanus cajan]
MKLIIITFSCIFLLSTTISARTFSDYINPDFTASYLKFIDNFGTFLLSQNKTFKAAIFNPGDQQARFYLCVIHAASNTIIWSANRDGPISDSGKMFLTVRGITIIDEDGDNKWSTPSLKSQVNRLVLTEMGNLVLLDKSNDSLWESFQNPTDTIVIGQRLPVGKSLSSEGDDSNNKQSSKKGGFPVAVAVLLPILGFIIVTAIVFLVWRKLTLSRMKEVKLGKKSPSSGDLDAFYIPGLPARFDYEELEEATDNFKTLIGSGGFGAVYKGVLPDKSVVAVKKIVNIGIQGKKDFCTEIGVIGNIHHVNLVKLKGFCAQGRHRLLVYEYMNRGSLDRTLFGGGPVLEWQERFDVALGTARGLAYLHSGCEQKVIHCDIKPENILLQDQFQAKISDFGLSKLLSSEQSGLFTTMRGTRGYLAPEWLTNSAITEKTDVYSFGMVLLELVSGRKNCYFRSRSHSIDDSNSGGGNSSTSSTPGLVYFPLFALEMHEQGSYLELADPRLEGRVTCEDVEKLVRIALCCVHEEPALRPNMVTVVGMLEGSTPLPHPRIESLNFLRFYGRRFTEASTIAEENGYASMLHQQARDSTSMPSDSLTGRFSYISSQNISGPR